MSISIVMGKPGVGKSTYLAKLADKYLKKGMKVYSNVYIENCIILDVKEDLNYNLMENGLVLIDEAGFDFDNRKWAQFGERNTRFFQMHRHYNLDVVLSVQFWDRVDVNIRNLTHGIYVVKPTLWKKWLICVKQIIMDIDISEDKTAIIQKFEWKNILAGGTKYYYAPKLWKLFNSYFRDKLNEKEWLQWCKDNEDYYIKDFTESIIKKVGVKK